MKKILFCLFILLFVAVCIDDYDKTMRLEGIKTVIKEAQQRQQQEEVRQRLSKAIIDNLKIIRELEEEFKKAKEEAKVEDNSI